MQKNVNNNYNKIQLLLIKKNVNYNYTFLSQRLDTFE